MTHARRTRFYGHDSFPEWFSPAARRFWLDRAEEVVRAEERLRQGEVEDDEIYDLVLLVTEDEEAAREAFFQRGKARQRIARELGS